MDDGMTLVLATSHNIPMHPFSRYQVRRGQQAPRASKCTQGGLECYSDAECGLSGGWRGHAAQPNSLFSL